MTQYIQESQQYKYIEDNRYTYALQKSLKDLFEKKYQLIEKRIYLIRYSLGLWVIIN